MKGLQLSMYTDDREIEHTLGWIGDINPEALLADGFNGAIIGMCERFGGPPIVAYDKEECLQILINNDDMSYEDALEFFNYNVVGTYMGEGTPVFLTFPPTMNKRIGY